MKVVYQTLLLLFVFGCGSSVYRISHEHLERKPGFVSAGIWVYGDFWVELLDDRETSFPFDESVWKSTIGGTVDFVDIVCAEGNIHRYGWNWGKKKFAEIKILTLTDGRNMTPFQYYDSIVNQRRVPI